MERGGIFLQACLIILKIIAYINLSPHCGRDKRITCECPLFAVLDEACRDMDAAIHGQGFDSLVASAWQCIYYFSVTFFF